MSKKQRMCRRFWGETRHDPAYLRLHWALICAPLNRMKKVKKAIIPAAGLGTRFLPATKSIPKEMLPIVDKPIILYVIEEAVAAGIEDVILITGRQKYSIEDFFDKSYEVEDTLEKQGKTDLLNRIRKIRDLTNIISIRQKEALGLGHAVYTGYPIVGNEPFAVLLGDEIMVGKPTVTEELCTAYEKSGISTVALMDVPQKDVVKYGIVEATKGKGNLYQITDVVEKPAMNKAPSTLALPGRYVFDGEIFKHLAKTKPGKNGEIQLTDGMTALAKTKGLNGLTFKALRYDAGDKFGYLKANIELGLKHSEVGGELKTYLKQLAKDL